MESDRAEKYLQIHFPVKAAETEIFRQYIAAHSAQQIDIWQARDVTFAPDQKLTPVAVAIWDSGVDVSLFPDQLFSDPHPTASGNHGLAFDGTGNPSTSWLFLSRWPSSGSIRIFSRKRRGCRI